MRTKLSAKLLVTTLLILGLMPVLPAAAQSPDLPTYDYGGCLRVDCTVDPRPLIGGFVVPDAILERGCSLRGRQAFITSPPGGPSEDTAPIVFNWRGDFTLSGLMLTPPGCAQSDLVYEWDVTGAWEWREYWFGTPSTREFEGQSVTIRPPACGYGSFEVELTIRQEGRPWPVGTASTWFTPQMLC